jgi:short-subunit dehydrogenase
MGRQIEEMVIVITGASSGIGKALAVLLARKRARLVLAARRLDKLEQLNFALGGRHLVVGCDVARPQQCQRLIDAAVGRYGRIDTLVCNAGYGMARPVVQTSSDEVRAMFETNVFGTIDCIRSAAAIMARQEPRDGWRGQMMIVSSTAGRRGLPYFGAYSATKFAQLGLAESLRVELRPQKIAVTSVHPIGTTTGFFKVAEQLGGVRLPEISKWTYQQSSEQVSIRMARAIAQPVGELWPADAARWGVGIGAMLPGVVDWVMEGARKQIEMLNEK